MTKVIHTSQDFQINDVLLNHNFDENIKQH